LIQVFGFSGRLRDTRQCPLSGKSGHAFCGANVCF
jgi:hypothetical protein